jgi:hypothetical protein
MKPHRAVNFTVCPTRPTPEEVDQLRVVLSSASPATAAAAAAAPAAARLQPRRQVLPSILYGPSCYERDVFVLHSDPYMRVVGACVVHTFTCTYVPCYAVLCCAVTRCASACACVCLCVCCTAALLRCCAAALLCCCAAVLCCSVLLCCYACVCVRVRVLCCAVPCCAVLGYAQMYPLDT